ncbi:acyl-CoA dehydrogenase, N-terminal domain protein [Rhodococcus sp. MTM3W5.2]|nr:acyl-CoA dehydrogenase, N-terminal domain protein [Rhodococcus sp. MTM3W5.2]
MYEWSDTDLMFRDALRGFIEKEIKPHVDKLESGELPPFEIIRKMYSTFGMDEMASEALEKAFAKEEARERGETVPSPARRAAASAAQAAWASSSTANSRA